MTKNIPLLKRTLKSVLKKTLSQMRKEGFWGDHPTKTVTKRMWNEEYQQPVPMLRHDATPWDINCGECENFAMDVIEKMGGEDNDCYLVWMDQLDHDDPPAHCAIFYFGRYYDAECLQGVEDFHDIPVYKNCGRTREEVLRERGEWDNSTQVEAIRLYA